MNLPLVEPDVTLDLKNVACPLNYVKAKLALEKMEPGQVLQVTVDIGTPADYVPRTLQSDGHEILSTEEIDGRCRILVRKGPEPAVI